MSCGTWAAQQTACGSASTTTETETCSDAAHSWGEAGERSHIAEAARSWAAFGLRRQLEG